MKWLHYVWYVDKNTVPQRRREVVNPRNVMDKFVNKWVRVRRDMAQEASIWRISLTEISEAQDAQSDKWTRRNIQAALLRVQISSSSFLPRARRSPCSPRRASATETRASSLTQSLLEHVSCTGTYTMHGGSCRHPAAVPSPPGWQPLGNEDLYPNKNVRKEFPSPI